MFPTFMIELRHISREEGNKSFTKHLESTNCEKTTIKRQQDARKSADKKHWICLRITPAVITKLFKMIASQIPYGVLIEANYSQRELSRRIIEV
ncbi:CLUMA_CG012276, isoform A [Clunio marinus]|uniref:CLUMA_CG012276, isoform A n=1 Tax=Clunio marinus TaxID=568069 RepID=A0A1J1IF66_9DIPT|nr:CLUMA_CG012276, isoform A [Clunio marinus]